MLSRGYQETRKQKLQSAQNKKASMTLRSAQEFCNKLLRIEVRQFTRSDFVMVVQKEFLRNIVQKVVLTEDNAKSVMVNILQY